MNGQRTKTVCVFGASGRSGRELIRIAVTQGLSVVAFCRNESARGSLPENVKLITGNLTDRRDIDRALAGSDAVVCVFGPQAPYKDVFCAAATRTIIESMNQHKVRRLLCVTGAMIGKYPGKRTLFIKTMMYLFRRKRPAIAQDREEQEKVIESSGLVRTIIKPPRLTDGPVKGDIRVGETLKVSAFSKISRADMSSFILNQIDSKDYLKKRVVIQY